MTLVLVLALLVQDEDKIGKEKAPGIVKKSTGEVGKKKGMHFTEAVSVSAMQDQSSNFDGVLKKDFAAAKGSAEIYAKGAQYLVRSGGTFVNPDKLQGQDGIAAGSFRNPYLFLQEVAKLAGTASWGNDADVDGVACKVADLVADEATVKAQIKEFADNLPSQARQYGDVSGYIDSKKTTSTYKVYIGKKDLLIYKIEWVLKPVIKENSLPPNVPVQGLDDLEAKTELAFSKYEEELDVEIPKEIQQKFGVK